MVHIDYSDDVRSFTDNSTKQLSILWTEVLDIVGKFNWPQYWIKLLTSFIKGIVSQEWALTGTEVARDYEMRFEAVLSDHPILYIRLMINNKFSLSMDLLRAKRGLTRPRRDDSIFVSISLGKCWLL